MDGFTAGGGSRMDGFTAGEGVPNGRGKLPRITQACGNKRFTASKRFRNGGVCLESNLTLKARCRAAERPEKED